MTSSLRTIGGHRLVAGLGKGGMARVYLALSQKQFGFTKLVVLKVLRDELDADGEFVDMFIQEARLAARLNHPNVVQTYEVGEDSGRHYIAMEYLEGQSLSSIISRVGADKLPLDFQLRVICDALEGLHYAHELTDFDGSMLGIVHRDVSPQNVFVTYTGQAKILDFGIAKTSSSARTTHGVLKGKSGYMAPEQATFGEPDRRTDLFAVGVMLWEALACRRLVQRNEDDVVALTRRVSGLDPQIRAIVPDAPTELADICDKAMARDPRDRYATAKDLREALENYLAKSSVQFDARRVAAILDGTFAEERTRIRRLVDEQAKKAFQPGPIIDLQGDGTVTPPSRQLRVDIEDANSPSISPSATGEKAFTSGRSTHATQQKGFPRSIVAGLALVAAVGVGVGVMFKRNETQRNARPDTTSTPPVVSSITSAATPKAEDSGEPATYKLSITSEPSGARVYEGDAVIGRTPIEIQITNSALRATQRHFLIKQDGFENFRVDPSPSHADVTTNVVLVSRSNNNGNGNISIRQPVQPVIRPNPNPNPTPPKPTTDPTATTTTRPLGIEPGPNHDLRPLDNTNPWEKKK